MKIFIVMIIMTAFGGAGYYYKMVIKSKLQFYLYLKNFSLFLRTNISLFKNNVVQIIDEFILTSKEKNAKYLQIFRKNGEIYSFDRNFVLKYSDTNEDGETILHFLSEMGKQEYDFERTKIDEFLCFLDAKIETIKTNLTASGNLAFKLMLSVGAVISIIIW